MPPDVPAPRPGLPVPADLLARTLAPYRPHCRYVRAARVTAPDPPRPPHPDDPGSWLRIDGDCAIGESCYIDDTGHFNAVEFNLTYNQLFYLLLAQTVAAGLLPELRHWQVADFCRHQLPDVLIVELRSRFHAAMAARRFAGWVAITRVLARPRRQLLLLKTRCGFAGTDGGSSDGQVTIALVRWQAPA